MDIIIEIEVTTAPEWHPLALYLEKFLCAAFYLYVNNSP